MAYQTRQKNMLLQFLKEHQKEQLSIEEIAAMLKPGLGKSTLYRLMSQLAEQGEVLRFRGGDQKSVRYQLVNREDGCHGHFHAQCTSCGVLFHLRCDYLRDLDSHMGHHHQFRIDPTQTILYGTCERCGKEG